MEPKMDGGLKMSVLSKEQTIKRDEYIALAAEGLDYDQLIWTCTPKGGCKDVATNKTLPLNSRVMFHWEIIDGEGYFVGLGCLPHSIGYYGDKVVFSPPPVPLPVAHSDTTLPTRIRLSIIDDNPTQKLDPTVEDIITIPPIPFYY